MQHTVWNFSRFHSILHDTCIITTLTQVALRTFNIVYCAPHKRCFSSVYLNLCMSLNTVRFNLWLIRFRERDACSTITRDVSSDQQSQLVLNRRNTLGHLSQAEIGRHSGHHACNSTSFTALWRYCARALIDVRWIGTRYTVHDVMM